MLHGVIAGKIEVPRDSAGWSHFSAAMRSLMSKLWPDGPSSSDPIYCSRQVCYSASGGNTVGCSYDCPNNARLRRSLQVH